MIGSRLGPYEVTAKLGEGGMGEVWRATDSRLRRDVAIKVLPAAFTEDPDRLARFEREAQLLAQLHHPRIASIFGVEESGGVRALVMELVEGPTLADRIAVAPIPVDEAIAIARQIAEALEEAHEKGIVHRDLKPANVKVRPDGAVKVLDFGLAKAMDPDRAGGSSSNLAYSPTLTAAATQAGIVIGTAAYMAPEQAVGGAVDRRADIWSFGVVVYEMLCGRRLFEGETVSHVLAGVLKDDPDYSALPAETPPGIRRLLSRCLRKKPRERLQAIGDARLAIDEALAGETDERAATEPPAAVHRSRPAWRLALVLAGAVAAGVLAAFALGALRSAAPSGVRTVSELTLPAGQYRDLSPPVLSPDGTRLALTLRDETGGTRRIWIRTLATGDQRPVPGTESARRPFWSPDGRSLGFRAEADGQIKRVDLDGGRPVPLAKAQATCGATWGRDFIVLCAGLGEPLQRVSPAGGPALPTTPDPKGLRPVVPSFLPDGRRFVFLNARGGSGGETHLYLGSVAGDEPQALLAADSTGRYDGGYLYYARGETLLARPFDPASGKLREGEPRIIAEGVDATFGGQFSVASGLLVYAPPSGGTGARIAIYDRTGKRIEQIDAETFLDDLVLSPDGRRAAVMKVSGGSDRTVDVWTVDLARKVMSRATYGESDDDPVFSPDGQVIAYAHEGDLYRRPANGSGEPERIVAKRTDVVTHDWTADGWIVYSDIVDGQEDLFAVRADGGEPKRLTSAPYREGLARVSPDGRWLAYVSDESGEPQVYLTTWPAFAGKWRVSTTSAAMPQWVRGGRELCFLAADSKLMRTAIGGSGDAPEIGLAEEVFAVAYAGNYAARTVRWAATSDGERFFVLEAIPEQLRNRADLVLVTNPLAGTGRER